MRRFLILSVVALLVTSAVAFSSGTAEGSSGVPSIRLATTWGPADSKGAYFMAMLEEYAAEHADELDLSVETYGSDDMVTKITVELASGELPDIFTYWGGLQRLGPLVEGDSLLDMEEFFDETDVATRNDFTQAGINHFTIDGVLRGLPMESNIASFVVNKSIFDRYGLKLPETYEDMVAAGEVLRENGIIPFAMASNGGNPAHFWFSEMYKQYDGGLREIRNFPRQSERR